MNDEPRKTWVSTKPREDPGQELAAAQPASLGALEVNVIPIPDAASILAGFVLAHAAWNTSDLSKGELLVPLAVIEVKGERHLHRFEAATQEQAIARGKVAMREAMATADVWAFARDGLLEREGHKVNVISVDCWAKGMSAPVTLVQEYRPFAPSGRFRIVGDPLVVVDGVTQSASEAAKVLERVRAGIRSHSKVASLWPSWQ
jgi:hypothetical protein